MLFIYGPFVPVLIFGLAMAFWPITLAIGAFCWVANALDDAFAPPAVAAREKARLERRNRPRATPQQKRAFWQVLGCTLLFFVAMIAIAAFTH